MGNKSVTSGQMKCIQDMANDKGVRRLELQDALEDGRVSEFLDELKGSVSKLPEIVRVDRSIKPVYPDWVQEVMHPELEKSGPTEYNISEVEQWRHDKQGIAYGISGDDLYIFIKEHDILTTCLGLSDLEKISKKDASIYREHFLSNQVYGWKGVVQDNEGNLHVPRLSDFGGDVSIQWVLLRRHLNYYDPALRFASNISK